MKTPLVIAAGILLAAMMLAAATARAQNAQPDSAADDAFQDPALAVASALPLHTIAPADVLKLMNDKRSDIALVDTQPASGFAGAHIPGATNYPWVMRIKTFPIALPRNKTLIFYGSCPSDTADIVRQLAEFGYFNVKIMDGGLEKWMESKYPTVGPSGNQLPPPEVSQLAATPACKLSRRRSSRQGRTAALLLAIALCCTVPAAFAQTPSPWHDDLADRMAGTWKLEGTVGSAPAHHTVTAEWILNHQFLRLREITSADAPALAPKRSPMMTTPYSHTCGGTGSEPRNIQAAVWCAQSIGWSPGSSATMRPASATSSTC